MGKLVLEKNVSKFNMKLLLFAASTLATNNESLFSVDDNGMGDVWCDVAYADCITNKATTLCGLKKNREIGLRALCIPHCGYRFADDKKFKNHCKDHLPEDFRSVSHCASHVCSCNFNFIVSLFSLIFDNTYEYDDSYLHSNGFNPSQQCFS